MQRSFVVCTASSTTLLLRKYDFHKISDSFHIFICNGVCHHYCKTQVLCQHVEWERDLLLLPPYSALRLKCCLDQNSDFSQTFSLGVSTAISEAITDIKEH